jgi:hypothetical protein
MQSSTITYIYWIRIPMDNMREKGRRFKIRQTKTKSKSITRLFYDLTEEENCCFQYDLFIRRSTYSRHASLLLLLMKPREEVTYIDIVIKC